MFAQLGQGRQPARGLQPERGRGRLLGARASEHDLMAFPVRQVRQQGAKAGQAPFMERQQIAQPQHEPGIHDVLGGGAPVHIVRRLPVGRLPVGRLFTHGLAQRGDQGRDRQSVALAAFGQAPGFDLQRLRAVRDGGGGGFGDYAAVRFGERQGGLEAKHGPDLRCILKQRAAPRIAEEVAKKRAVQRRDTHAGPICVTVREGFHQGWKEPEFSLIFGPSDIRI